MLLAAVLGVRVSFRLDMADDSVVFGFGGLWVLFGVCLRILEGRGARTKGHKHHTSEAPVAATSVARASCLGQILHVVAMALLCVLPFSQKQMVVVALSCPHNGVFVCWHARLTRKSEAAFL